MSINPGKLTMSQRLARDYWRAFKADGGVFVSASFPVGSGTHQNGVAAELPICSGIQLAAIREAPELKLNLLRNRRSWASDDDDDDDRDRDESIRDDDDKDDDADDEDQVVIRGTPIPYNQVVIQDETPTIFKPGAFQKHLATKPDIAVVAHFDLAAILGRTKSGTAVFSEDALGLQFSCLPPNTTWGNDLLTSIYRKDTLGASAAVVPTKQRWEMIAGDRVRIVEAARLVVASVVAFADSDSIRVSQQSDLDDDDDLAAAAHPPFNASDRSLLHDMGIESAALEAPGLPHGLIVRATGRSRRAALRLESERRRSLNAEGLRD